MNESPKPSRADQARGVCVVVAAEGDQQSVRECLEAVRAHADADVEIAQVAPETAAVNRLIEQLAPADVVLLSGPCRVGAGWIPSLAAAAHSDTNNASASALADAGTPLALGGPDHAAREDFTALVEGLAARTRMLRPRLSSTVGPCVYLRRDALELVGALDERLDLRSAVEVDFAQRCVLSGMTHVAADDVVVERLGPRNEAERQAAPVLHERYPYLEEAPLADSPVLGYALQCARRPAQRVSVTLDARALDGAITGTHVHILELILALVRTDAVALRLLVRGERLDEQTRQVLSGLSQTTLLCAEKLDPETPRSAVFHRPQQTFSPGDITLALALGERFVISQLDLIAYRNPGYFADGATWEDYRAASRHGLSAAERVVVFSEHTRDELLSDALVEESRIRIVPPGLDHRTSGESRRPAAIAPGPARHAVDPGFLLCLGTDFRHKNRLFALRLLAALRELFAWEGYLVFAGAHISPGSSAEIEGSFLREHQELRESVVSLGPVDESEKEWLIANSGAIVYPSVYEGFGLVPFESALRGVPCVFAPQASLAETAPPGTATIVPWDANASAAAAYSLLTDPDVRGRHVRLLATRAQALTWDAAAAAMVEIYREAAAAPVRDSATLSRDIVKREARLSVQHDAEVRQLVGEREHAQRMYDELNDEVGSGLRLIGPNGHLPDSVQRALLALAARPALSRPLFAAVAGAFVAARAVVRPFRALLRRAR